MTLVSDGQQPAPDPGRIAAVRSSTEPPTPRPILVIGVAQRSGTHLVHDLLCLHRSCSPAVGEPTTSGSDWEHYLMLFGDRLEDYRTQLVTNWQSQGQAFEGLRSTFDETMATWLESFLARIGNGARTVAKSPSAENLDVLLPWLLAQVDVVMVVRDPRAVLQSARLTFGDSFERRLRAYVRSAQAILRARAGGAVLVRYEDLLHSRRAEVLRLLDSLALPSSGYDFDAADQLPIRGSSTAAVTADRWHGIPWHDGFDGASRGSQLPTRLRRRVEWVAGREMDAFGYDAYEPLTATQQLELKARDAGYRAARKASRVTAAFARTERYVYTARTR
jgi:hypothetical protein